MEIDARALRKPLMLDGDLCIVGAGPAGLTLAHRFIGSAANVVLIESGARGRESGAQRRNRGDASGDRYGALDETRYRSLGGTVQLWNTAWHDTTGGKYLPLDAIDFERRDALPGWPFDRDALEPWYRQAQQLCELGPFEYGSESHAQAGGMSSLDSQFLGLSCYRIGSGNVYTQKLLDDICEAPNVTLLAHATVTELHGASSAERMERAVARVATGADIEVRARAFVLAAGALENARLLLACVHDRSGFGGEWVGRCFMEHPRDNSLVALDVPGSSMGGLAQALAAYCDVLPSAGGALVRGRLAIDAGFLRAERLHNASLSLFPLLSPPASRIGAVTKALHRLGWKDRAASGYPRAPDGWSRMPHAPLAGLRLLINLEQAPHPDNRVTLAARRDAFGVPMPALHWRWREPDAANLERLHALLRTELARIGLGRFEASGSRTPDPNAHHHAGTTRMSADAAEGVVDPHCRVHQSENLYVAGSSVFPSAGFANPTLTIVALSMRLAEHLRKRLHLAPQRVGEPAQET